MTTPRKLSLSSPKLRSERSLRLETLELDAPPLTERVFEFLDKDHNGTISAADIFAEFELCGLRRDDPRIASLCTYLAENNDVQMNYEMFQETTKASASIIEKCFGGLLCIPMFNAFRMDVQELFNEICGKNNNKTMFAVSMCTIDGQRHDMGTQENLDEIKFCMEECCKPILYSMAMESNSDIDEYISHEPSGLAAHTMALQNKNGKKRPHNPLMNTGALVSSALLLADGSSVDKIYDSFIDRLGSLFSRDQAVAENIPTKQSMEEEDYASINKAIAYMLDASHCFPNDTNIDDVMKLFFQSCATTCTVDELSLFAATLANGGIHPISGKRIIQPRTVHH
ncbi:hypothetical protein THRCLA_22810, partial [Thraustotheca clavata]